VNSRLVSGGRNPTNFSSSSVEIFFVKSYSASDAKWRNAYTYYLRKREASLAKDHAPVVGGLLSGPKIDKL